MDFDKIVELAGTVNEQNAKLVTFDHDEHQGKQWCVTYPSMSMFLRKKKKLESFCESGVKMVFGTGCEVNPQGHRT